MATRTRTDGSIIGRSSGIPPARVFSEDAGILCSHRRECLVGIWGMFDTCANWFLFLGGLFRGVLVVFVFDLPALFWGCFLDLPALLGGCVIPAGAGDV